MREGDRRALLAAFGNLVGQYQALSSTNKSAASAFAAKDFAYIFDTSSVATFLPQAIHFLSNIPADLNRFRSLLNNVTSIKSSIIQSETLISVMKGVYKLSDEDINNLIPPETLGEFKAAQMDYAQSVALLADQVVGYTQRLDEQAAILLSAWDATKKTEATSHVFGAITVVIDILTGIGIGGNAIAQSIFKDLKQALQKGANYDRLWNGIGLRAGQVGDMLQAALNSGVYLSKLGGIKSFDDIDNVARDADISIGTNLTALLERVKKYQQDEKSRQGEKEPPNPFIPI